MMDDCDYEYLMDAFHRWETNEFSFIDIVMFFDRNGYKIESKTAPEAESE